MLFTYTKVNEDIDKKKMLRKSAAILLFSTAKELSARGRGGGNEKFTSASTKTKTKL